MKDKRVKEIVDTQKEFIDIESMSMLYQRGNMFLLATGVCWGKLKHHNKLF